MLKTEVLKTVDLTPAIGSQVMLGAEELLSGEYADQLRDLLVQRGAVVMRDIHFNDDQLRAFAQTIGTLRMGTIYEQEFEGMLKIRYIPGSTFWHIDGTYTGIPPFATVLAPSKLAPEGQGDTAFASLYAAYDDLPEDEKEYLSTLKVVHTMKAAMNYAVPEPTLEQFQVWEGHRQELPLVWQHKSGRRTLLIGITASHIVGMHPADSYDLLMRLNAHATQDKYVYRHKWKMGDVALWDNTGSMHRALPYEPGCGREMHRFTLEGVEQVTPAS